MSDDIEPDVGSETGLDVERLRRALLDRPSRTNQPSSEEQPTDSAASDSTSPEEIWDAASGEGERERTLGLLDRAMDDPNLALEWRLARELRAAAEQEDSVEDFSRPSRGNFGARWYRPMAIAASIFMVALVAVFFVVPTLQGPSDDGPPVLRQPGELTITSEMPAGGIASGEGVVLRWSGVEAARYEVSVLRPDTLQEVFHAENLEQTFVELPVSVLDEIPADGVLLWRVEALLPHGDRVRSETFSLQLDS